MESKLVAYFKVKCLPRSLSQETVNEWPYRIQINLPFM